MGQLQTMNLQKIPAPTFDGTEDVAEFLQNFELVAKHNKWSDEECFIRLKFALVGSAKLGVTGTSFEELVKQLKLQYELTTENALILLKNLKWKAGSNIHQFAATLKRLVKLAYPGLDTAEAEKHCIRELTSMLPQNSQAAWLLKANPPANLNDAVQKIHEVNNPAVNNVEVDAVSKMTETMMNALAANNQQHSNTLDTLLKKMADTQQEILKALQSKQPGGRTTNNGPRRCWTCQQTGHVSRSCPTRQGNANGQRE